MSIRIQGSISATSHYSGGNTSSASLTDEHPAVMPSATDTLASSGDVAAMIAALLLESGKSARESAKLAKDAAAACEDAAHARKLEAMETAADRKLVAGIADGAGSIGQGVMSGVGGDTGAKFAPAAKGDGSIHSAVWNHLAGDADRDVAQAEREVTQAKRNIEATGDMDKDAKDLLRRAMSHYAEYVRARDDASKAALFRA